MTIEFADHAVAQLALMPPALQGALEVELRQLDRPGFFEQPITTRLSAGQHEIPLFC